MFMILKAISNIEVERVRSISIIDGTRLNYVYVAVLVISSLLPIKKLLPMQQSTEINIIVQVPQTVQALIGYIYDYGSIVFLHMLYMQYGYTG